VLDAAHYGAKAIRLDAMSMVLRLDAFQRGLKDLNDSIFVFNININMDYNGVFGCCICSTEREKAQLQH